MFAFLNGKIVPETQAVVSVFDRGFLYGDGLFETLHVVHGEPFRWTDHITRLQRGADFLKITLPYTPDQLREFSGQLMAKNKLPDALLRLTVSRGDGARGYSPKNAGPPTCVMTLHPAPEIDPQNPPRWKLITPQIRLPLGDSLTQFKTANKLWQVLARAEADAVGADEALLLNTAGHVAEATSANVFWVENDMVCTPPLAAGILPGVTRVVVLELCARLGVSVMEKTGLPEELLRAEGVFLTMTSLGVVPVAKLDGHELRHSPLVETLCASYADLLNE